MTDFYAPNQQVVRADGSGPAEEGIGGSQATPKARAKTKADTRPAVETPKESGD